MVRESQSLSGCVYIFIHIYIYIYIYRYIYLAESDVSCFAAGLTRKQSHYAATMKNPPRFWRKNVSPRMSLRNLAWSDGHPPELDVSSLQAIPSAAQKGKRQTVMQFPQRWSFDS